MGKDLKSKMVRVAYENPDTRKQLLPIILGKQGELRSAAIRLAYNNPSLRSRILPIIVNATDLSEYTELGEQKRNLEWHTSHAKDLKSRIEENLRKAKKLLADGVNSPKTKKGLVGFESLLKGATGKGFKELGMEKFAEYMHGGLWTKPFRGLSQMMGLSNDLQTEAERTNNALSKMEGGPPAGYWNAVREATKSLTTLLNDYRIVSSDLSSLKKHYTTEQEEIYYAQARIERLEKEEAAGPRKDDIQRLEERVQREQGSVDSSARYIKSQQDYLDQKLQEQKKLLADGISSPKTEKDLRDFEDYLKDKLGQDYKGLGMVVHHDLLHGGKYKNPFKSFAEITRLDETLRRESSKASDAFGKSTSPMVPSVPQDFWPVSQRAGDTTSKLYYAYRNSNNLAVATRKKLRELEDAQIKNVQKLQEMKDALVKAKG